MLPYTLLLLHLVSAVVHVSVVSKSQVTDETSYAIVSKDHYMRVAFEAVTCEKFLELTVTSCCTDFNRK
jgi:hypothetical protein